jgi:citrate synthase
MSAEYVPGLEGIIAARTEISLVDGANGRLVYRGYVIADLAEEMSFERSTRTSCGRAACRTAKSSAPSLAELVAREPSHPRRSPPSRRCPRTPTPWTSCSVVSVQGVE